MSQKSPISEPEWRPRPLPAFPTKGKPGSSKAEVAPAAQLDSDQTFQRCPKVRVAQSWERCPHRELSIITFKGRLLLRVTPASSSCKNFLFWTFPVPCQSWSELDKAASSYFGGK